MKFTYLIRLTICLSIILFSQLSYGQRAISEKINENLNKIRQTTQKQPLQEISEDLLEIPIEKSILNRKQILQINASQVQNIKNNKSEYLRMSLPIKGQNVELELYRANIFTENFRAESTSNPNQNLEIDRGLHYWGIVADKPNSLVTISFVGDEIVGGIHHNGEQISLAKLRNSDYHVLFANKDFNHTLDFACEALPIDESQLSLNINEAVEKSSSLMDCVGIHIEVDRTIYQGFSNNMTNTTNYVNALFAQMAALYTNESIQIAISFLRVWDTADPYGAGTELDDLTNQGYSTTDGNLVHLLHSNGGGGVAYLQGLCDNTFNTGVSNIFRTFNNIPTYSWDVEVFTHEIGHNLGSPHTHACAWNGNNTAIDGCGPASGNDEGCDPGLPVSGTIMSYCHLVGGVGIDFSLGFGPQPGDVIRSYTASRNCGNFCTIVCPAQVTTPYSRTEDLCAGITTYTLPTSYAGLVLDNNSAAAYEWSTGNYISAGGSSFNATAYSLTNPPGCDPITQRLYLNVGCSSGGLNDIDAGVLTLNIYPDPTQFTAADLVTVNGQNACDEPIITANCAGVTVTPDATNTAFPAPAGQSGTANYTITYTSQAGTPNCCVADSGSGTELITNGDFEAGATAWAETEEVPTGTPNANPFGIIGVSGGALNGSNDAWFGGWGTSSPDNTSLLTISQNINIPATCAGAELTFDYGMSCVADGITLSVVVNGVLLGSLNCTDGGGGSIPPFDLIAAGAPSGNVTFSIIGNENGTANDAPDIYIDNVSILTTACTTPVVCEIPLSATYDCQQACAGLDLDINFDANPAQTSWEIIDASGNAVALGGTYGSQTGGANLNLPSVACLPDGCYELSFYDTGNDGMCPRRTTTVLTGINIAGLGLGGVFSGAPRMISNCGDYTLTDVNGTVLASGGGRFGTSETNSFCISGGIAALNYQDDNSAYLKQNNTFAGTTVEVQPSLASDYIDVFFSMENTANVDIRIVDMTGKTIQQETQTNGNNIVRFDVHTLSSGIYFVQFMSNDNMITKKFVKK